MQIKNVSRKGLSFLTLEEGCVLYPYLDKVGIWTIGIGCTYYPNGKRVTGKDKPITLEVAISMFKAILKPIEQLVWSVTVDTINQQQFDALASLCYNIGVTNFKKSSVVRRLNANTQDITIKNAFSLWNKGTDPNTGRLIILPGLVARRKREGNLYFS